MLATHATNRAVSLKNPVFHPMRTFLGHLPRGLCGLVLAAGAATALISPAAQAGERRFTYVYEAAVQPKGVLEFEQWVTWKTDKNIDSKFDRIEFRHELEYGVTDNFQFSVYLADWRYQDGRSVDNNRAEYRNSAVELIYKILDPVDDDFGLAIYGEVKLGDELFELEGKLILQKNIGKWVFAWNGIMEAEWEGSNYDEDKGEFGQTIGASYQFSPKLTAGIELLHEVEYDDWSRWKDHVVYLGPNVSMRTPNWWITVTPMFQVTDIDSEPNFQARFIFGFDF